MIGDYVVGSGAPAEITACVQRLRNKANQDGREDAMDRVRKVRRGEFALVWPDQFNENYPTAIVANFVDVAARDLAANLSPLPSLACSAGNINSERAKQRAENKNRIGSNFWRHSRLKTRMKYGADQYLTYGFLPFWVEADYVGKIPRIHVEDPVGAYYDLNRDLQVVRYAKVWQEDPVKLAALFPEYEHKILRDEYGNTSNSPVEVVRYIDKSMVCLYLSGRQNLVVAAYQHGLDFCPVHVALRPGVELDPRGQFDDVLWVQLAHTVMAALTLELGHKAVQAPMILPSDVQELPIGPDSAIVTDNPNGAKRLEINVPQSAFVLGEQLASEMREGAGYPDTRFGQGPAGGSTGRGISALEGGFDTQIQLGQDVLGEALRIVTEMCFKMDAALWPNTRKEITGTLSGESFKISYTPGVDLADDTECEVTYGFAAGVSANSMIVTLLQLRGDEIIGRRTFRRNLPFDIDDAQQQRELDEQQLEDAVMQGVSASLQAVGQMFASGQTQTGVTFLDAAVKLIRGRRQGQDLADLIDQVLIQPIQQQQQAAEEAAEQAQSAGAGAPGTGAPGDATPGVGPDGLPVNVAPGQAGLPPGGRPSIMDLTAGFNQGGGANVGASIRRRIATG